MSRQLTVVFAGGGTGGHIFPALAIADQLKKINNENIHILFVGAHGGLETQIIPNHGYPLYLLPIGKLNYRGQWLKKIKTVALFPLVFLKALYWRWCWRPDVVIGMGGYASGPMVWVAAITGVPSIIWEANAKPGLANRWLSHWVKLAIVVFPEAGRFLAAKQVIPLGMPVRSVIDEAWDKRYTNLSNPQEAGGEESWSASASGAGAKKFIFFVFGGSQGARALNRVVFALVQQYFDRLRENGIRIVHQVGSHDWQEAQTCYASISSEWIEYHQFIQNMPQYYEQADVVMCRAGASSVAEVMAYGLVTIFVPLPLAESHQLANAKSLADVGAALIIEQKELTSEKLFASLLALKRDPSRCADMRKKMLELYRPRASLKIAELIMRVGQHEF